MASVKGTKTTAAAPARQGILGRIGAGVRNAVTNLRGRIAGFGRGRG